MFSTIEVLVSLALHCLGVWHPLPHFAQAAPCFAQELPHRMPQSVLQAAHIPGMPPELVPVPNPGSANLSPVRMMLAPPGRHELRPPLAATTLFALSILRALLQTLAETICWPSSAPLVFARSALAGLPTVMPRTNAQSPTVSKPVFVHLALAVDSDVTTQIQQAINSLPNGGGTVYLPPGRFYITNTIEIGNGADNQLDSTKHGTRLIGAGGGFYFPTGTYLVWNGGPVQNSVMVQVNGNIQSVAFENISLNGAGNAHVGLRIHASHFGRFSNFYITDFRHIGLHLHGRTGLPAFNNFNVFENFMIAGTHDGSVGLLMDGDYASINDTWLTTFINARLDMFEAEFAYSAFLKFSDSCTFIRCHFVHDGGQQTYGIAFDATESPGYPSGHVFHDCSILNTIVYEDTTDPTNKKEIRDNYFVGFGTYDNEPLPTHPRLKGFTETGKAFNSGINIFVNAPSTSASAGMPGQIAVSGFYLYVYTGNGTTHTWKRTAISSW